MPKQKNNIVMKSTRGMFGKQVVFKKRDGKFYVAAPPEVDENRKPTARQLLAQERFKACSEYAVEATEDPVTKAAYLAKAKRGLSAYNVAFSDAYNAPKVKSIITQAYQGQIGNVIVVQAKDDFKVASVQVAIYTMDNELVEQGAAVPDAKGKSWIYTATEDHIALEGSVIKATAKDIPGNEGSKTVTL